jgi:hypothetical protein
LNPDRMVASEPHCSIPPSYPQRKSSCGAIESEDWTIDTEKFPVRRTYPSIQLLDSGRRGSDKPPTRPLRCLDLLQQPAIQLNESPIEKKSPENIEDGRLLTKLASRDVRRKLDDQCFLSGKLQSNCMTKHVDIFDKQGTLNRSPFNTRAVAESCEGTILRTDNAGSKARRSLVMASLIRFQDSTSHSEEMFLCSSMP